MKQKFLIVMFMGLSVMGWGQAQINCKKEVDEFTHDTVITADLVKIGKHKEGLGSGVTYLKTYTYRVNSTFVLVLWPEFLDIQTIKKGSIVYFKFQDESVLELLVDKTDISDHTTGEMFTQGSEKTIWYNSLSFILTPAQLFQLESKKIKRVRCSYNDYDPKDDSQASVIIDQIRCIREKADPRKSASAKKKKKGKEDSMYGN